MADNDPRGVVPTLDTAEKLEALAQAFTLVARVLFRHAQITDQDPVAEALDEATLAIQEAIAAVLDANRED